MTAHACPPGLEAMWGKRCTAMMNEIIDNSRGHLLNDEDWLLDNGRTRQLHSSATKSLQLSLRASSEPYRVNTTATKSPFCQKQCVQRWRADVRMVC